MSYQSEKILYSFQKLVFDRSGKNIDSVQKLKADASDRKIYRLNSGNKSFIGIFNENEKENIAFIKFTEAFLKLGFNVPEIINVADDNLFYIEEDLGDMTLYRFSQIQDKKLIIDYYKKALADLISFQIKAGEEADYNYCYQTAELNGFVLSEDIKKFREYFLNRFMKDKFGSGEIEKIVEISAETIKKTDNSFFVYRDFQPRNIMLQKEKLFYIDYQSGRKGPLHYDAASFLYSGSVKLNEDERINLLDYYESKLSEAVEFDKKEFRHYFYYFAFFRMLQVLGSYSYIYEKRSDADMLLKTELALEKIKDIKDKIENKFIAEFIGKLTEEKINFTHI